MLPWGQISPLELQLPVGPSLPEDSVDCPTPYTLGRKRSRSVSPTVMSQSMRNIGCDARTPQVPMASLLAPWTPPSIENLVPGSQALSGCSQPSHPTGNLSRHIVGSDGKEAACSAGDLGLIPGSGRSPGGGHGNPLQYSGLENSMDRGAWRAMVHGAAKSWTQLSD